MNFSTAHSVKSVLESIGPRALGQLFILSLLCTLLSDRDYFYTLLKGMLGPLQVCPLIPILCTWAGEALQK